MKILQADFYKRPLQDEQGNPLWSLLVCDASRNFVYEAFCPQPQANSDWIASQLQGMDEIPNVIEVFRPQSLSLLSAAANKLGITIQPTRHTPALKEELLVRAKEYPSLPHYTHTPYQPTEIEQAPPQGLPEALWGEEWRFATITAGEIENTIRDRPIPILEMPDSLLPVNLGLASTIRIPGVVIYGGRQSMRLARWLQEAQPVSVNYIPTEAGKSGGLILESGLVDRWVIATFEDAEVATAAMSYQQRQQTSKGLHFLLVQPDDSGMTFSGFWLLKA